MSTNSRNGFPNQQIINRRSFLFAGSAFLFTLFLPKFTNSFNEGSPMSQGIKTYGVVAAPIGAKDWYRRNYHLSPELAVRQDKPVVPPSWEEWDAMKRVNRSINAFSKYRGELTDYWGNSGIQRIWTPSGWRSIFWEDCDDTVVRKVAIFCEDLGIDRRLMSMTVCDKWVNNKWVSHLVLIVTNPYGKPWVFDNTIRRPAFPFTGNNRAFKWIAMEVFDKNLFAHLWGSLIP